MATQGELFTEPVGERVKSPICSYMTHCGATALLGEPEDCGECINRDIVCEKCGARGVQSTSKEA